MSRFVQSDKEAEKAFRKMVKDSILGSMSIFGGQQLICSVSFT